MTEAPKPCPFCGEVLEHRSPNLGMDHYTHLANDCVLSTTGMGDPLIVFDDAESIAAWNRRSEAA